jgi:plastocyanin
MQLWYTRLVALAVTSAMALTALNAAEDQGWGTIKGQVVLDGKDVPKRAPLKVDKDQNVCLKNGPLLDDKLVVNPKNNGVRWTVVYLMNADDFKKPVPIHPALKNIAKKVVEVDQPCCQFEPHVVALRQGQTLVVKNTATIAHNVKVDGGPSLNQIVPPGKSLKLEDLKARPLPLQIACNIHGWMLGRVFVLPNPYFAVTDADGNFEIKNAPAGDFRVVAWHEAQGWLVGDAKPARKGKKITIKANETTDLGKIPLKPSKD